MPRPNALTFAIVASFALVPAAAMAQAQPGDAALSCAQIASQIGEQNAIVKHATRIAKLHANEDEGTTASPEVTQANSDAAAASARSQTLLGVGRSKKCFQ